MDRVIRIGRISKIDYETGQMSVTYPDLDDSVTALLSVLSYNDEWKPPQIGDEVAVLHFPNGQAKGLILGHYWNKDNTPAEIDTVYLKEFGTEQAECFQAYDGENLSWTDPEGTFCVKDIIDLIDQVETLTETVAALSETVGTINSTLSMISTEITGIKQRLTALENAI